MKARCVFFDRDGVANFSPPRGEYVQRPDSLAVDPAFLEALRIVKEHGYLAIIITNQQGVGKGLYSTDDLESIHQKLMKTVRSEGLSLDAIFYCPHLITDGCVCRKPEPGMLLQAAEEWGVELTASWMVGDSFSDIEAGAAAGCRTILVNPKRYERATNCIKQMTDLPALLEKVL